VVGQIGASGEVLALQPSVLVGATLPRTLQIAEVHLDPGVNPQPGVLDISAPWSQFLERRNCSDSVVIAAVIASRTASAPCPLSAGPCLILGPSRPSIGGKCNNMVFRLVRSTSVPIVELPRPRIRSPSVTGDGAIGGLGGLLTVITSLVTNFLPRPARVGSNPQRPAGPHARNELALQPAAVLHVQSLVDRLVGDPHRRIISEVAPQPVRDAPSSTPTPAGAACCGPSTDLSLGRAPAVASGRRP